MRNSPQEQSSGTADVPYVHIKATAEAVGPTAVAHVNILQVHAHRHWIILTETLSTMPRASQVRPLQQAALLTDNIQQHRWTKQLQMRLNESLIQLSAASAAVA